ncbi:MAG: HAD family acid phosphatase [Acidobacteriota bacterium]
MPLNRIHTAAACTALILPILTACAHRPQTADPAVATPAAASPVGNHPGLDATLWVQTSAEFQATNLQTFRLASLRLEQALEDRRWTAALEQDTTKMAGLPPAIIADVDETLLDNSSFQALLVTEGLVYEPATWDRWVRQSAAPALQGAREFLQHAASLGVTIFYVTNRGADQEPATRRNLERQQMPIDGSRDVVLMNGENGWTSDKTTRRQAVAESHRILLLLGDDLNDFVSGARQPSPEPRRELADRHRAMWGTKWFLFANPSYGSWEESLYGMSPELSESEKRSLKRRHLVPSDP